MAELECSKFGVCGGCAWGGRAIADQHTIKINEVRGQFADAAFADLPTAGLRDKVDLIWEEGRLGLYELNTRVILDLEECAMMSPALEEFFKEYRARKPPIRKGSVRLRVSPSGERGVWLDFANQDVKMLFDEKEYLRWLSSLAFVEIGQKRKHLTWVDDQPKLKDALLKPWFETYGPAGEAIALFGPVGGFSQSGFTANRSLVGEVLRAVNQSGVDDWVELFCGNGNFTLALAAAGKNVEAIEMDELAVAGLEIALQKNQKNVQLRRADVYLKTQTLPQISTRGLLVDPPRAGLRQAFTLLEQEEKPKVIVYVSCFTETLNADLEKLKSLGYQIQSLRGVDQFPHSPHAEWVVLLTHG